MVFSVGVQKCAVVFKGGILGFVQSCAVNVQSCSMHRHTLNGGITNIVLPDLLL